MAASMMRDASSTPSAADIGLAPLELLVGRKEVLDLPEPMRAEVIQAGRLVPARIIVGDGQDLVVVSLVVGDVEDAHRAGADDSPGGRLADYHQDVEGVAVVCEAAVYEAVIAGVVNAAVKDPVKHEAVPSVVVFVRVPAARGDLDRDLDGIRLLAGHGGSMRHRCPAVAVGLRVLRVRQILQQRVNDAPCRAPIAVDGATGFSHRRTGDPVVEQAPGLGPKCAT